MRTQVNKVSRRTATKSERRFLELLKQHRIKFRTKVRIAGREIDFLIGKYAIDIDCHDQDGAKNEMLVREGYIPIHYSNKQINKYLTIPEWIMRIEMQKEDS